MMQNPIYRRNLLLLICFGWFAFGLLGVSLFPAQAAPTDTPAVSYLTDANTVVIGNSSGAPASQSITIPQLDAALTTQGLPDLLIDQGGGVWLLKASLLIDKTAKVEATNATITWLRLESPPVQPINLTAQRGGHLLINRIKVTSWDSAADAVDQNLANGRAYLLALEGGRMDILHSEVAYLGWESGEASGLAWRKRLTFSDPTTGATGRLEDSKIHHNLFGMYSYEAYGITILRNEVYDNIEYGIDPHDDSRNFEVAYNKVYRNGNHGIIFSRLCQDNVIHNNEVYDNLHGIMLDRGTNNNVIRDNVVYNNSDGIAIFQSSDNLIQNNHVYNNKRGIRINATYDLDDVYDGVSANNRIEGNRIEDNSEHGIYLYARADRNLIINNSILRSGVNGVYIKSGGNRLENNIIRNGVTGVTISGGEYLNDPPIALDPLDPPGNNNVVISTTVASNSGIGIRIMGGSGNRIGSLQPNEPGNRIESNGIDGISIGDIANGAVSTNNQVLKNTIHNNQRHGIAIKDVTSVRNRLSQNSITNNGQRAIRIDNGAQQGILPPIITGKSADGLLQGKAQPNATVEIYHDPSGTGQRILDTVTTLTSDNPVVAATHPHAVAYIYATNDLESQTYLGSTVADGNGGWTFALAASLDVKKVTALTIDQSGNTSALSSSSSGSGTFFAVAPDDNGQTTIQVTGSEIVVTLAGIQTGLGANNASLLQNLPNGAWQLNANLFIGPDVTLDLSPTSGVNELRLRSEASTISAGANGPSAIDYASFVYLRTHSGQINMNSVKVYSWDRQANAVDTDIVNGRAYVIAKYAAALNINNSELSYLGSADGESYGVSWRDINSSTAPDQLRSRVTGEVIDSKFFRNYYGIYTYQASDMVFRGNQFYENIRYGFDPHDFTHDVLVENNLAFNNGSHGFIISRGCNNFVIRGNKSYNNSDPSPTSLAHGFMLDPGSPNSEDPQAPSFNNLLENNEAYGNEGYALRVLGSNDNEIRNNLFRQNQQEGVVIDQNSLRNLVVGNTIINNVSDGLDVRETADGNTIADNIISENGVHGVYVRSNNNVIRGNQIVKNLKDGIVTLPATGVASIQDNQLLSNTISLNGENGIDLRRTIRTLVEGNVSEGSGIHGLYLSDSAGQNAIVRNIIRNNNGHGIRANGLQTLNNTWSQNQIYGNLSGGIATTSGANSNMVPPQLLNAVGSTVTGKTAPGYTVEIFSDLGLQGQIFEGSTVADGNGDFSLTIFGAWRANNLTGVAIDTKGNASVFGLAIAAPIVATPTPTGSVTPTATSTIIATEPTAVTTPTPTNTPDPLVTLTPTPTGTPISGTEGHEIYLPLIKK